ncbi:MAG: peptidyl-prolyl cis-trans isomerase [Anaeromyxobacteraceae bacterium]
MNKPFLLVVIVLAAGAGYWAGHASSPKSVLDSTGDGAVVARFSGHVLRVGDVEARLRAMPDMVRARLRAPEARKGLIEDMVREQLLAHLAEEKGYQRDSELAKRYAEELGNVYLEKEFEEPERKKAPTEDELRKYFDEHHADLARPERVRIAIIGFNVSKASDREGKRALAQRSLLEARAKASDYYAFGKLARARSGDERTRASSGELGFVSREELGSGYGPELAKAAFGLTKTGEVGSAVVESAGAFYVVKLLGREAAYEPRFEAIRDALQARVANERRSADRERFLDDLWKAADVKIDDDAVKKLELASSPRR